MMRQGGFLAGLGLALVCVSAAMGQTKIGKVRAVHSMFQAPDGRLVVFCSVQRGGNDYITSIDKSGKEWNKPVPLPSYSSAAIGADGTIWIGSFTKRGFSLDSLAPTKEGWEHRKDTARIHDIAFQGELIGPKVVLAVDKDQGDVWAYCAWREDEIVGEKRAHNPRAMVFRAGRDGKFAPIWEDKSGFIRGVATLAFWGRKPVVFAGQHYVCALAVYDGGSWNIKEKLFDFGKINTWISDGIPRAASTGNGYLHIGQRVNGVEKAKGGSFLLSLSPEGRVSCLEIGGEGEAVQFVLPDGDAAIVGVRYSMIERFEDVAKKYDNFYAIRCIFDPAAKQYRKANKEASISETQTSKGEMVAAAEYPRGGPLPVAYVDDGALYFKTVSVPGE